MNIFFDLDGTLIDSSDRLYVLFSDLVPESKLSKEEYWQLKRNKINHKQILIKYFDYSENDYIEFEKKWLNLIETPKYIKLDKIKNGAVDILKKLNKNCNLYVLTSRQDKKMVLEELTELKLIHFFKNILVTEGEKTKIEVLSEFESLSNYDIIVGDTGLDILTGKELNLKTIAVSDGFLSEECLLKYKPDKISSFEKLNITMGSIT